MCRAVKDAVTALSGRHTAPAHRPTPGASMPPSNALKDPFETFNALKGSFRASGATRWEVGA
jgi:hypothetical protein